MTSFSCFSLQCHDIDTVRVIEQIELVNCFLLIHRQYNAKWGKSSKVLLHSMQEQKLQQAVAGINHNSSPSWYFSSR